ncbi:SDR family NAD(P)-dependent oxidoreductase [Methylobacterium gnaphalii]|uniref:Short-chain dehydrogenase n=1 Tax=Methylobacterium gnaphalii TaxID=1010610 RepID=A0A512JGZ8_9HYPH|nr:SDR family NAD(P)-dependent oxidoreductase [Methylobacterium gnaphalii]GEP09206.1 short-chain dehydrogenase [Methylobacterium gnaphalii]GJD67618.1 3-oxoacyl-[acyl-carrier-protein] reductase FabG [Methylobacterium gnaphalii]GLS50529.1 short-chain dehydrogenase [Methylobacterium gnaphalii]
MNIDLTGKSALVTGSTGGIGYAVARELARLGASVAVNGRTGERVEAAIAQLKSEVPDGQFIPAVGSVSSAEGVDALVASLPAVDILINNAGIFEPRPFFEIEDREWQRFFDVNVMSGIRLSRAYTPGMVERGWGRVVFIASESGINIPVEMVHYGMTKTAQLAISRGLAETVGGSGVTVNSVLPGPTLTEGVAEFLKSMGGAGADLDQVGREFIAENRPTSLIKRLASAEEVASMVAYLCTPAASATTGAALRVDGGVLRSIA